jgi:hypothetical protein
MLKPDLAVAKRLFLRDVERLYQFNRATLGAVAASKFRETGASD